MKNKGITLIGLVITIIVMLILAGVSVVLLFGENGLFNSAKVAKEQKIIGQYKEGISLATTEGNSNAQIEPEKYKNKEDILDDIEEIIRKNSDFRDAKIYKVGSGTEEVKLVITTKEGYVFYVETDKTTYKGTKEEAGDIELDIELTNADINSTNTPAGWTNGKIEVTISAKEEYKEYELEYSYDIKTWTKYERSLIVEDNNTKIYVRLREDNVILKGYAIINVINIDRLEPKDFTPEATSTTKSITVTAETTDQEATEIDGKSEISGYRFKLDSGEWTEYQESGTYTWDNLAQTTNHTITVEAKDNAGNTKQGTVTKGTGTIETAGTASYTPTTWTNGKVTVTLPTKDGFTTRYTTDGTLPTKTSTEYSSPFTVSSNCTITYIYTDGTNIGGTGTANVTNIDTTKPVVTSATANTNTITIKATDEASGIIGYAVTTSTTEPTSFTSCTNTKSLSITPSGYTQGTTYYVWVKDEAENVSAYKQVGTGTVPSGKTDGVITFSTASWSSGKASITISTDTNYQIQYQVNSVTGTWTTGTSVTGLLHGDIVYARLWDGTNAGEYATQNILDSTAPTAPTLAVTSGTAGNGWYRSNVVVKITAGTDAQSGVNKVTYVLSGATTKSETTITSGGTITISAEGSTVITAYTYDVAGNKSAAKTLTIKKDTVVPTSISLTFEDNINQTNGYYTIKVSTSDARSGIQGYYYSTNGGSSWSSLTTSSSYKVSFTANFSHTVKVRAVDNAGNTTDSGTVSMTPKLVLIRQLYEQMLGRQPDSSGLNTYNSWTNAVDIAWSIITSEEANNKYGTNNTSRVTALYKSVLGRTPSSSEVSAHVSNMNTNGFPYQSKAFPNSAEFKNLCSRYSLSWTARSTSYDVINAQGRVICNLGGRNFYKYTNTGAIGAVIYIKGSSNWVAPLLVSTSPEGVKYSDDYYTGARTSSCTVTYRGTTYYVSSDADWMPESEAVSNNLPIINSPSTRYSNLSQAAQALLSLYYQ